MKKEHFIGVDAIEKQLKAAKKDLSDLQKSLGRINDDKKIFDEVYADYTKFTAGNNFTLLEKYCDSERKAKELGIRISEIKEKIAEFYDILVKNKINVTVRRKFGRNISAACGQLRSKEEEK